MQFNHTKGLVNISHPEAFRINRYTKTYKLNRAILNNPAMFFFNYDGILSELRFLGF